MFLCLTNHQPKTNGMGEENLAPMNPLAMLFGPTGVNALDSKRKPMKDHDFDEEIPTQKNKPSRKRIPAETPKDGASIYLNIEKEDVVALIPLKFGGTEIVYLSTVASSEIPKAMEGGVIHQKTRMSVLVKESPSALASMLGIAAKGA